MRGSQMPRALTERLGDEGTHALSTVLESVHAAWSDDVVTLAAERFDRTLSCEISKLRVEVVKELATLRVEFSKDVSAVRQDFSAIRADLFKWSFLFWIGQVAAVAGLLAFMLRSS